MAATMHEVEVWVLVDDNGDYVASQDADQLNERYEENIRPVAEADGLRRVKLTVKVPLPEVIELRGEVPAEEEPGELQAV